MGEQYEKYLVLQCFLQEEWIPKKETILYHCLDSLISVVLVCSEIYQWYDKEFREDLLGLVKDRTTDFLWSPVQGYHPLALFRMFRFELTESVDYIAMLNNRRNSCYNSIHFDNAFIKNIFMVLIGDDVVMNSNILTLKLFGNALQECALRYDETFPEKVEITAKDIGSCMDTLSKKIADTWVFKHTPFDKHTHIISILPGMISKFMGSSLRHLKKKIISNIRYYIESDQWEYFIYTYGFRNNYDIIVENCYGIQVEIGNHLGNLYLKYGLKKVLKLLPTTLSLFISIRQELQYAIIEKILIHSPQEQLLSELKQCDYFYFCRSRSDIQSLFSNRILCFLKDGDFITLYNLTQLCSFSWLLGVIDEGCELDKLIQDIKMDSVFWDNLRGVIHPRSVYRRGTGRINYLDNHIVSRQYHLLKSQELQEAMLSLFWFLLEDSKNIHSYYSAWKDYNAPKDFQFPLSAHSGKRFKEFVRMLGRVRSHGLDICPKCGKYLGDCFKVLEPSLQLFPEYRFIKSDQKPLVLLYDTYFL